MVEPLILVNSKRFGLSMMFFVVRVACSAAGSTLRASLACRKRSARASLAGSSGMAICAPSGSSSSDPYFFEYPV